MGRKVVVERLEGYAFGVANLQAPNGDQDAVVAEIHYVDDPAPGVAAHEIVVPLTAVGKQRLIAQLTGGIIVGAAAPE